MTPQLPVIRLESTFFGSTVCCLGGQLVALLLIVREHRADLMWYVADVAVSGFSPFGRRNQTPVMIGDTATLIQLAEQVDQVASGVFMGVPSAVPMPQFRAGGVWTDDDEEADLGEAVVEIRAFDTSYWSIAAGPVDLANGIRSSLQRHSSRFA